MFYKLFLGDCCLGKQCYDHCKYKYNKSSADIRIGDLWGTTYADDEDGVSAAIALTNKGYGILQNCNCKLIEHSMECVSEYQMTKCPPKPEFYDRLIKKIHSPKVRIDDIQNIIKSFQWKQRQINRLCNPIRTVNNLIKRICK